MSVLRPTVDEAYDSGSGLGGNRDYFSMLGTTWDEARDAVATERSLLAAHDGDPVAAQAAHGARVEEEEEQGDPWLAGLDVGVAGAVHALSAAGVLTVASCNGAAGHHEGAPVVAFTADADRLAAVLALAAESGLQADDSGNWTVLDGPLDGFGSLADRLIASAGTFDAMEQPRPYDDDTAEEPLYPSWS